MAKAGDDAYHVDFTRRLEYHGKQNFTLYVGSARFLGVRRAGFEDDLDRLRRRGGLGSTHGLGLRRGRGSNLTESALTHPASSGTARPSSPTRGRDAVAESRAGNGPLHPVRAAGAIAVTRSAGQIKRTQLGHVPLRPALRVPR